MKKNIKNQKGAISLFVLLSMMFFLAFMLGAFTMVNRRNAAQVEALKEIEKIYGRGASAADKYDAIFASEDEIIPITNFEELKIVEEVCKNVNLEKKYLINGKVYTYNKDVNYVLQNDIVVVDNEDKELLNTYFACIDLLDVKVNSNRYWVYYEYETENGNKKIYEDFIPLKKLDNTWVALDKDNLGDCFGDKIDYTPSGSVNGYVTSSTYRLFYIDFDNKYGDGKGTIYLKADCTDNKYDLQTTTETSGRYLQLNKKWNDSTYTSLDQNNKKASAWLLDENNWSALKDSRFGNDLNYVVGGPSLDLFVDSYNTYLIKNTTIDKQKINYRYNNSDILNKNGYQVKLENNSDDSYNTNANVLLNKLVEINVANGMYNPGNYYSYWLASPAYINKDYVTIINENTLSSDSYDNVGLTTKNAICPIASITLTRGYLEVKS